MTRGRTSGRERAGSAWSGLCGSSCAWVPVATTRPSSMATTRPSSSTTIWSVSTTVGRRCAMISRVRSAAAATSIASFNACSSRSSRLAVGSSSGISDGSAVGAGLALPAARLISTVRGARRRA
ncbi:MAG: hypothetical protein J0I49_17545 [Pseudonocardia sp.]|uniref:hypothetical protein n=1 Tax=Pseudonocardia sp. TaxID=60912 RepID=UPI001AC458DE|nr:hypothetical protein [Pseudonocardia sp.]MBN9099895.1 hypothetical protein [Pseudonocardia sp.]